MTGRIYPLTFAPELQDYVWGGRNLEKIYGRELPPGVVAESWEISGHPAASTRADHGYWAGQSLPAIMAELGLDLVGTNSQELLRRGRFPLLVKLLDANRDLSVQVHPDDRYAAEHKYGDLGKTEMWYVLHAEPGTELIYGLAEGVTPESFRQAIAQDRLETQLHRESVEAGDCIYVPAGTIHALLAGAVVVEIQQNSDTTYRVYDWGRLGTDGKPRPLHVDKALDVIDWDLIEPGPARPRVLEASEGLVRVSLVDCPQFTVERFDLAQGARYRSVCDGATFEIWGCVEGAAALTWKGEPLDLAAIRFALLPAALGEYELRAQRPSTLLRIYVTRRDSQSNRNTVRMLPSTPP